MRRKLKTSVFRILYVSKILKKPIKTFVIDSLIQIFNLSSVINNLFFCSLLWWIFERLCLDVFSLARVLYKFDYNWLCHNVINGVFEFIAMNSKNYWWLFRSFWDISGLALRLYDLESINIIQYRVLIDQFYIIPSNGGLINRMYEIFDYFNKLFVSLKTHAFFRNQSFTY